MRLRYGVIGAGVVAPLHLEAIAALDDVELVGISALDREAAEALAQGAGCAAFPDHRDLLALQPDVVVICTPHPSHPALTAEALEAGAHVLVEKPLAPQVREADAMIESAERAGRLLGVCFQQRFRPVIAAARELIVSGRLGALVRASIVDPLYRPNSYYATADWRGTWTGEGGGVLMNQAPHTLDLLCHLAGPPSTVWGVSRRRSQPMEAEDTATALLEYPGGATGTLAVSTTEPGVQRIELVGDRGRIEIVGETIAFQRFEPPLSEHLVTATGMFDQPELVSESVELPPGRGDHGDVHQDFAAAIRSGAALRVPARDALWSLELANAIVLSTHTGRAVPLPVDRDAYAALLGDLRSGKVSTPGG
jgi:UDP-N-acetyl-2-amino-2-deoxyglucuronate dehydrogenase